MTEGGHISENDCDYVTILDRDGKKVKSFGHKSGRKGNVKFSSPHGVAITPDKFILVADTHKIQKISVMGNVLNQLVNKVVDQWNLIVLMVSPFLQ